jgi:hypothetical protein
MPKEHMTSANGEKTSRFGDASQAWLAHGGQLKH